METSLFLAHGIGPFEVDMDAMSKVKSLEFKKSIYVTLPPSNFIKGVTSTWDTRKFTTDNDVFYGANVFNVDGQVTIFHCTIIT